MDQVVAYLCVTKQITPTEFADYWTFGIASPNPLTLEGKKLPDYFYEEVACGS